MVTLTCSDILFTGVLKKIKIMKTLICIFLVLSLASCTKDFGEIENDMIGTWEYERYSGFPFNIPPLPPGNGQIIVMGENGKFERKQQDTLLFSGSYSLDKKKDCYDKKRKVTFSTSDNPGSYSFIEVSDGKLILSGSSCNEDAGASIYIRIR